VFDQRENGGIGADAERERHYCDGAGGGSFADHPPRVAEVGYKMHTQLLCRFLTRKRAVGPFGSRIILNHADPGFGFSAAA
jgi:hypothetical protein